MNNMHKNISSISFTICIALCGCSSENAKTNFFQDRQYPVQVNFVYDVGFTSTPMPITHDKCSSMFWIESHRLQDMINQHIGDRSVIEVLQHKAIDWEYLCHQNINAAKSDAEAKAKKALEKRKQLKVTSLKSYDLPIWLGLPHKFPDKWQDCHSYFEDAGIRLRFSMRQGEFEIGRSLIRKDENSQSNLLSFTQNAVQVQQNLLLWFSDCNKQADN